MGTHGTKKKKKMLKKRSWGQWHHAVVDPCAMPLPDVTAEAMIVTKLHTTTNKEERRDVWDREARHSDNPHHPAAVHSQRVAALFLTLQHHQ
jgi:hypothetical protein